MTTRPNYRTTSDAGIPRQAAIERAWPRATECGRWSHTRGAPNEKHESQQDIEHCEPLGST
jgi:hypothetical protein